MAAARGDNRILVSADTEFGALLATFHDPGPSIVLMRRVDELAGILVANLPVVADDLDAGCMVVIGDDSMRVRQLPI